MFGVKPETDQGTVSHLRGAQTGKSYKFAGKLTGRFFVSGISGSFQKHRQMLDAANVSAASKKKLLSQQYMQAPFIEKAARDKLKKEAEQLLEMEEKIKELQRRKEMKRAREQQRRQRKLYYLSSLCIQTAFRKYISKVPTFHISIL